MNSLNQYADIEMVRKIVEGEFALFEILIRRYNAYLYKIGRSYHYSHEDTQDLMQDTFIDAYSHLPQFENRASFKTWLIKIMLNNCFRKRRKLNQHNEIAWEIGEHAIPMYANQLHSNTNKSIVNKELHTVIENALQKVSVNYSMVFTLRELNGLSVAETAEAMDLSETNVKVRLNRAKAMLRKEIEKTYSTEDIFEFNLVYCDAITANVMNKLKTMQH